MALAASYGCAAAETAGSITIGEGEIDRISQSVAWPSVDDLTGLTSDQLSSVPGLPASLADGTFAHLQGALRISGDCIQEIVVDDLLGEEGAEDGAGPVSNVAVRVISCSEDDARCDHWCEDEFGQPFFGMMFNTSIDLELLNQEQADEIQKLLAEQPVTVTADAIVQIRLQFHQLQIYQGEGADVVDLKDHIEGFELWLENEDGDEVLVVDGVTVETISPETPQRYDVGSESQLTAKLKQNIFDGNPTRVTVTQRMRIPQAHLYEVSLAGGGLTVDVQPEVVVSAVEVATATAFGE